MIELKVGYSTNHFTFDYIRDSSIIKNVREVPILRDFLSNHKVYWLGSSQKKFDIQHENAIDCSAELLKLPNYDAERFGSTKGYVRWILDNYETKLKINLPKLDCLFLNSFPSFLRKNVLIYLLWLHYAKQGTRVFIYDIELHLLHQSVVKGRPPRNKPFSISGADSIITPEEYNLMAKRSVFLYPIGKKGIAYLEKANPKLRFETFYFINDKNVTPYLPINNAPKNKITYVGNNTGRRKAMIKYFKHLPDGYLTVYGGAARGETEGYPENLQRKLSNVKFAGKIPHYEVNGKYNDSIACLNIGKPRFEPVTFQSARWNEVVSSGCILLLPNAMPEASFYVGKRNVIKSSKHLYRRVEKLYNNPELREKIIRWQRKRFKKLFNKDEVMKRIYRWL